MNLNNNPTTEQLRELLKPHDDCDGHHVLWVKGDGEVVLSRIPVGKFPVGFQEESPEMRMYYDPFLAGNEYVGPETADDSQWITALFESLRQEWPKARGKSGVTFVRFW